jgi:hypothetical protein
MSNCAQEFSLPAEVAAPLTAVGKLFSICWFVQNELNVRWAIGLMRNQLGAVEKKVSAFQKPAGRLRRKHRNYLTYETFVMNGGVKLGATTESLMSMPASIQPSRFTNGSSPSVLDSTT